MKPFSLLIKPTSADCNLRCPYCFYLPRRALYPHTTVHRMSHETLERLIASYLATDQPQYVFGWQGGEPALMGVEFYREVTRLQQKHGRPGSIVANSLQTNATLLDDTFAAHLATYRFLVGVSLDGPAEMHDRYRRYPDGRGSHAQVMQALACLRRHGVEHNVLTLVTSANVERPREVFHYLLEQGLAYQQYIPCVEFDAQGRPLPWTITGPQWGHFLCQVFDEWLRVRARVSVRLFDALLAVLLGELPPLCHLGTDCRSYLVVEYNGDVYPCDFFVNPELLLGNIRTDSWASLRRSERYASFGKQKAAWAEECEGCEYVRFCAGDCLKHRWRHDRNPRRVSWLCAGWRQFYTHALPTLQHLVNSLRQERQVQPSVCVEGATLPGVARNAPCPCGSGRKFKKCCGASR